MPLRRIRDGETLVRQVLRLTERLPAPTASRTVALVQAIGLRVRSLSVQAIMSSPQVAEDMKQRLQHVPDTLVPHAESDDEQWRIVCGIQESVERNIAEMEGWEIDEDEGIEPADYFESFSGSHVDDDYKTPTTSLAL